MREEEREIDSDRGTERTIYRDRQKERASERGEGTREEEKKIGTGNRGDRVK